MRSPSTLQLVLCAVFGSMLFWIVWLVWLAPTRGADGDLQAQRLLWAADERALVRDYEGARVLLRECVKIEGNRGRCASREVELGAGARWHSARIHDYDF